MSFLLHWLDLLLHDLTFPGKNFIFSLFMASLMIPGIILLVPKFIVLNELNLINTYAGIMLPGLITVVNIFLMKQFFETIPKDLEEAALIDGCSYFQNVLADIPSGFQAGTRGGCYLHLSRLME